ncbi:MAG: hypothetical protein KZQ85_07400 [Candidatus Thiodiazotropha sp. (ex Myrtea sp. 'scaly one' KF741663)]|nr:hypothetical protein [Candidatus Thiodiazotropha sp. (ex Myrtea sp. 'scaly one' KF741663)]
MWQGRTLSSLPVESIPGILFVGLYAMKVQGHQLATMPPIINRKQNPRTACVGKGLQTTVNQYGIFGMKGELSLIKS